MVILNSYKINSLDKQESTAKLIRVRFLQGPLQNKEWIYNSEKIKIVRIGRSKTVEIVYRDESVSKIQCT